MNDWTSPWRIVGWLCIVVIVGSVLACGGIAAARSTGLTAIEVTATDASMEPRDHKIPLVKQKEALPDYELILLLKDGRKVSLGARPDTSAVAGLTWEVSDSLSVADVTSVRLREQDKVISDALAEVQISEAPVTEKGYRFEFTTARSLAVGIHSFFRTPVGNAICVGFGVAVFLLVVRYFV